ncbi:LOW QUALITY PROTEIN: ornithine decarboxylase antizyme 3 [Sceloporus undulatus]|uniref:LOW QUALITY PROTEIN: ornithine decarboxylase antizyme 3 n=1 Tax=Sceloporus undulatus TaxID=8520 RepID=UPI001C4B4273|nr:LOW QUALITY PROTEIN: ornithine decarboxylase antizyme 3 [Sceloporus undulatus]
MTPLDSSSAVALLDSLSHRPRYCLQCSEFEGGCPDRRRTNQRDSGGVKEIYKAGNLTVFASDRQSPDQHPIQLDFHFARGSQGVTHWHGLLRGHALFLDTPRLVLDFNSRDSLAATLEYIEEKTEADQVFVNFHKSRRDRGDLLRAFGFLGFELVRPDHPGLPPWEDTLFMVYPMEREPCPEKEQETLKTSLLKGQDEATLLDSLLE